MRTDRVQELEKIAKAINLPVNEAERVLAFLTDAGLIKHGFQITSFGIKLLKLPRE